MLSEVSISIKFLGCANIQTTYTIKIALNTIGSPIIISNLEFILLESLQFYLYNIANSRPKRLMLDNFCCFYNEDTKFTIFMLFYELAETMVLIKQLSQICNRIKIILLSYKAKTDLLLKGKVN